MTRTALALIAAALLGTASAQTSAPPDVWEGLRALEGTWRGEAKGEPGEGTVERSYRFVLGNSYIEARNRSVYKPGEANPQGETHEDWGMISFDKARKRFVLRQFHVEGFVNQYTGEQVDAKTFVFTSESIENIPAGWRARETYRFAGRDEFTETFELAEPGKEFQVYTRSRFRREK